jgi:hypothetical protein
MNHPTPALVCNPAAISAAQRPRYNTLVNCLRSAVRHRSELSDGFSYLLDSERITLAEVAEWITFERLCCPFLTFQLEVKETLSHLALRGPIGTKAILREAFSIG